MVRADRIGAGRPSANKPDEVDPRAPHNEENEMSEAATRKGSGHERVRLGRIRPRIGLTLICSLFLAAGAVACGESAPSGVVKIGVIAPIEDGLTSFGRGIANSVQLAVDEANEADAIPGFTIEAAIEDDSSDPETGRAAAEALAEDPTVIGVVGTYNSGTAAEAAPILDSAGIAMISPGNTDPMLTVGSDADEPSRPNNNYFRVVANDSQQGVVLADFARVDLDISTAAVVNEEKSVSQALADSFSAAFEEAGGEVIFTRVVPDGTSDFEDVAADIEPLEPDLLFFGGEYEVGGAFRRATSDIDAPVMGGDGIKDDRYIEVAGAASEGDHASSVGVPIDALESASDFVQAYNEAGFEEGPSAFGPYAYDAANLLIEAAGRSLEGAEAVGDEARADLIDLVQESDAEGITGRLAFDEFGDTVNRQFTIYRVEEGVWVTVESVEAD